MSGQSSRPDLYAVLGVPRDATQALIDHAYRTLVRRYHPDSRGATDAEQASSDDTNLRHVMAAYGVIGNPDRRTEYDQRGGNPSHPAPTVSVRVRPPQATDGALVTAGPVYWSPRTGAEPIRQRDTAPDGFSRAPRPPWSTPQPASARPTPGQRRGDGMPTETPSGPRHVPELDVSELVEALTAEVAQLRIARESNRRIGMAVGIVMNQLQVDDLEAFDALRRTSQNTNRKLREVAEDIIQGRHTWASSPDRRPARSTARHDLFRS
jgi:curved DNA-binding protein CbpA